MVDLVAVRAEIARQRKFNYLPQFDRYTEKARTHGLLLDVAEAAAELRAVVAEIAAVTPDWAMAYGFTSEMRTAQEWLPKLDAALKRVAEGQ